MTARIASPRRILMTADAVGGVWQYALQLAGELAGAGTETVLAVLGPPPSSRQQAEAVDIPGLRLAVFGGKLEWMPEAEDDVARSGDWLLALEERYRPNLIHLNGFSHGALPWRSPVLVVAHSCVRSWWWACHGCEPPQEWDGYVARVSAGLHGADMVVAPTRAFLDEIVRLYGAPRVRRVIPNGRTPPPSRPRPKQRVVMAAGRLWDEAKNLRVLEGVAARTEWPIRVAGELKDPAGDRRPPPNAVQCLGPLSQETLMRRLLEASVFVHPALYEPFGLCALEAAQAGCALVLGDVPTLRELWDGAAVFVDPRSEEDIAAQLDALVTDPSRRIALAAKARERARRYDACRMAKAYREAYSDLLSRVPLRAPALPTSSIGLSPHDADGGSRGCGNHVGGHQYPSAG